MFAIHPPPPTELSPLFPQLANPSTSPHHLFRGLGIIYEIIDVTWIGWRMWSNGTRIHIVTPLVLESHD